MIMKDEEKQQPRSHYTMDERMKALRLDHPVRFPVEETSLIQPFPEFNVLFEVPRQLKKWYINKPEYVEKVREGWKNINEFKASLLSPEKKQELELLERQKCAFLVQLIGQLLQMSQFGINHSMVLMHRFYIFHPVQMFPFEVTAGAAISLGSKSEEQAKNNNDILSALLLALDRKKPEKEVFDKFLEEIFVTEEFMAMTLGYDFLVKHPNKYIHEACKLLNITNEEKHKLAADELATNSLHLTTFCIRYPPRLIAAFSIHLTSLWAKFKLEDSIEGKPWYYYIHKNITLEMLEIMRLEFLRNAEIAPENFVSQLIRSKFQLLEKRRIAFQQKRSSRQEDLDEDESNKLNKRRDKFTNERPQDTSKRILNERLQEKPQPSKIIFTDFKKPASSCPVQRKPVLKNPPKLQRLLPQQHLYQPTVLNQPPASHRSRMDDHSMKNISLSVDSIEKPATLMLKTYSRKRPIPAKLEPPKPRNISSSLDDFLSSSKGIKSTVPLKMVPPKAKVTIDLHQQPTIETPMETPNKFTSARPSKQRVAHDIRSTVEISELPDNYDDAGIHEVSWEQIVDHSESSMETSTESFSGITLSEQDTLSGKEIVKSKKPKKSKRKKMKHDNKHSGEKFEPSCEKSQNNASLKNFPLKMVIKKSKSGFEIKQSTTAEKSP